ncbi:MAG: energy-coupling factor ABC transporter permease [Actinomycetota bacterium]|nr:energy-coupling factor ABC transporter permease [Actinomycetota bacterium]
MLNFPVVGGTSGHFLGAVFAAILLGPWMSCLTMAMVLFVQCLIFQDGGLTALGANIFNMGIIGGILGYYIYFGLKYLIKGEVGTFTATFLAAWASVVLASAACAIELAISGTSPLYVALPAMVSIHALIGIGEGLITTVAIALVHKTRPDLLALEKV